MTRTTPAGATRVLTAAFGVAGVALLAGCAPTATDPAADDTGSAPEATEASSPDAAATGAYAAGTYEADGDYRNPRGGVETVHVTMTLTADGTVESVDVTGSGEAPESKQYQSQFIGGIQDEVVGKKIDELNVTRVAGSSLTSGGFNAAVEQISSEAARG